MEVLLIIRMAHQVGQGEEGAGVQEQEELVQKSKAMTVVWGGLARGIMLEAEGEEQEL